MGSVYSNLPMFDDYDDMTPGDSYHFSKFNNVRDLVKEFLFDYPRNKIFKGYFKSLVEDSDIAGIFCQAIGTDIEILDSLLGYIDIPAGVDGLVCDLVKTGGSTVTLFIYDNSKINPTSVKSGKTISCGTF